MDLGSHIPFYQVDTFTGRPFHGSPASVFLPDEPLGPLAMQLMAREMNLPETAFVLPAGEPGKSDCSPLRSRCLRAVTRRSPRVTS